MTDEQGKKGKAAPRDDVLAAHLDGEAVLLDMDSKDYFRLNDTAAFVWKRLERGMGLGEIVAELCSEYDVEEEQAQAAVERLLEELRSRGLLESPASGADG